MTIQYGGVTPPLSATSPVYICSFVKMDVNNSYQVVQCAGPQDKPIGICQQPMGQPPGWGLAGAGSYLYATPSATSLFPQGQPFQITVFGLGSIALLQLSPSCAAIVPGQQLCSDANGFGIDVDNPAISGYEAKWAGAIAMASGSAGSFIRVLVIAPQPINAHGSIVASLTPTTIAANTTTDETFTVAGLGGDTNSSVSISWLTGAPTGVGIVNAAILSANSLKIRFGNFTSSPMNPGAGTFAIGFIA